MSVLDSVNAPVFERDTVSVACISDTHNDDCRNDVPRADIFVHAGDMTNFGSYEELRKAFEWICSLPHKVKVVVGGTLTSPIYYLCLLTKPRKP